MLLANNACMGNETCTVLCHVCAATTQYNVKTPPSLPPSLTILNAGHNELDGAKIRTGLRCRRSRWVQHLGCCRSEREREREEPTAHKNPCFPIGDIRRVECEKTREYEE